MKKVIDKAESRGRALYDWLDSHHTFSFDTYYNPRRMNFGALRVLNDDRVEPGKGFGTHPHKNMEIISIPLKGKLKHGDSQKNSRSITPGDIQTMSAGTGIYHSEMNGSDTEPVEFLQIWVMPEKLNTPPAYQDYDIRPLLRKNELTLIVSPDGDAPAKMLQQAWFSIGEIEAGKKIGFFSLASIGNSAQTKELTAADLALAASEQVAALQAQGADAILCIAGPDTDISGIYADLADLGVTAVLDAGATANSTAKANGIAVVAAGSGWDSVGCLNLTFAADGSMTAEPASMSAADLKSARGSYTTAQQTAYDSAFTSLQSLADGDEDVRSQTLFTFEANESADKTISFANYAAALYLAYADGDRANCPQDAADLTVTALAGGITELDFGDVTRGALCDAVPAGQRLVLARTTSAAIGALIDTGTVTRTYEESLTAFEPTDGDALVVTDTATLEALEQAGGSYTILRDYGDVFWDIRMNINDVTNNFANPFTLPEAPQRGAGRK